MRVLRLHRFRLLARLARKAGVTTAGILLSPTVAAAATYPVPSSIHSDCSVDVTGSLLRWIASEPNDSTLAFATGGCYRIEGTLELFHRRGLDFEGDGATFRSFDPTTDGRAIWRVWNSTGIIFHDMTIEGSYTHGGTFDPSLQHADAIDVWGTSAHVIGVTMLDLGGDCVDFAPGGTRRRPTRSSGSVLYSTCTGTSRNAVSVSAGDNIAVQHVTTDAIGFDVFDVEPGIGLGFGARNVTFDSNTIGSYNLSAYSIVENEPVSGQAFTNNVVVGRGLKITVGHLDTHWYPVSRVTIADNRSSTPEAPAAMNLSGIDRLTVTNNAVPLTGGLLAEVDTSCGVEVSANVYPGGNAEVSRGPYGDHALCERMRRTLMRHRYQYRR